MFGSIRGDVGHDGTPSQALPGQGIPNDGGRLSRQAQGRHGFDLHVNLECGWVGRSKFSSGAHCPFRGVVVRDGIL